MEIFRLFSIYQSILPFSQPISIADEEIEILFRPSNKIFNVQNGTFRKLLFKEESPRCRD